MSRRLAPSMETRAFDWLERIMVERRGMTGTRR